MTIRAIQALTTIQKYFYWGFLILPLSVFFLPAFQTVFEEDIVIFVLCGYFFLRACNQDRHLWSDDHQAILLTVALGAVYGIGWLGLLRGYEDSLGRWLAFYPLSLITAAICRPPVKLSTKETFQLFLITLGTLTLILFSFYRITAKFILLQPGASDSIFPRLILIPIFGSLAICAVSLPPLNRGKNHLPVFAIIAVAMLCIWAGNIKTWMIWYRAGELERAWTPFKAEYENLEKRELVERKPYDAAILYGQVYLRLLEKGDIPRFLNWPFFMRYRMAVQAMRKQNAHFLMNCLPPSENLPPDQMEKRKDLWHMEFLWGMQQSEPAYPFPERIWVDAAWNSDKTILYTLDRWGRVYSIHEDHCWLEWDPPASFNDAIDLEISQDHTYAILRGNGQFVSSQPRPILHTEIKFTKEDNKPFRFKFFPDSSSVLLMNRHGEIAILGDIPAGFPSWKLLSFRQPVVADIELDPDGKGYYLLDIYGAVHANHPDGPPSLPCTNPPVPKELLPYWDGINMAIDLALDPQDRGLYVYNRIGEIYTITMNPYRETYRPQNIHPHRGVALQVDAQGRLFALEANGRVQQVP